MDAMDIVADQTSDCDVANTEDGKPLAKKYKISRSDTVPLSEKNQCDPISLPADHGVQKSDSGCTEVYDMSDDLILEDISDTETSHRRQDSSLSRLEKIESVVQDARNVSAVLGIDEVNKVYEKLRNIRCRKDRKEIIANQLMDQVMADRAGNVTHGNDTIDSILQDIDKVKASVLAVQPGAMISSDEIFSSLEKHAGDEKRVEIVKDLLLRRVNLERTDSVRGGDLKRLESSKQYFDEEDEVLSDCENVLEVLPNVDPYEVYKLMNKHRCAKNRAAKVMEILNLKTGAPTAGDFSGDPLYHDTNTVSAMFPRRDKNEIYAYLEAHYHTPNRVQVVCDELLHQDQGSQSIENNNPQTENSHPDMGTKGSESRIKTNRISKSSDSDALDNGHHKKTKKHQKLKSGSVLVSKQALEEDVKLLLAVFPDGDPEHLYTELKLLSLYPDRIQRLSNRMFEDGEYPKLKDRLYREERAETLRKLQSSELDIEEFFRMYPNPEQTFFDSDKPLHKNYEQHCLTQLKNNFPLLKESIIRDTMNSVESRYFSSNKKLEEINSQNDPDFFEDPPREPESMPEGYNEFFYMEVLYCRHEQEINDHEEKLRKERAALVEEAKKSSSLVTCPICCEEELFPSEMRSCQSNHQFCSECVRRGAESSLGTGLLSFTCLEDSCKETFPLDTIQKLLKPTQFAAVLRKRQEREILDAKIEDLVSCPFCPFAMIMPDANDKVLKCLNPDCMKDSCRFCQRLNHVPLSCDEAARSTDSCGLQNYIEMKMTEAIIRRCWRCNRPFFKVDGCNKMSCPCGAAMCYLCRKPVFEYGHFSEETCPIDVDSVILMREEMEKAGLQAMEQYKKDHPNMSKEDLNFDPLSLVRKKVRQRKVKPPKQILTEVEKSANVKEGERKDESSESEYEELEIDLMEEHYHNEYQYAEDRGFDEILYDNVGASGNEEEDEEFEEAVKRFESQHGKKETAESNQDDNPDNNPEDKPEESSQDGKPENKPEESSQDGKPDNKSEK